MPSFDAVHNTGREAIHSLSHIHALRKHYPRFAQAIQGLSGQSMDVADPRFAQDNPWMVPIHGLRRTYVSGRVVRLSSLCSREVTCA